MNARERSRGARTGRGADGIREWFTPGRIAFTVLAVLAIVFIFENTERVEIRVLIPVVTMPLYLALLAMFVVGALCGGYLFRRKTR
ncbi:LapA family protein [Streptomyces yaizuensis]|uniref:LapA family protein n=1 Tax=Streptomyces yaizuensis TaxID=2989713 RepID=A0ABQ5PB73_9ACTN|nr:LapA family protein [Streptomyces sp. YSPA8]GLF99826.1 LapA family protein [Streptomyces sp. YSPA8]